MLGLLAGHRGGSVYEAFLDKLKRRVEQIKVGPATDPENYMGPVINARAKQSILEYIEIGKKEGRLITGGGEAPGPGHFIRPTVIADVAPKAVSRRRRFSDPCWR